MASKIAYGRHALTSLENIERYLRAKSLSGATNVLTDIAKTIEILSDYPLIGIALRDTNLRYQITSQYRYRIVYRISGDSLQILQIYHPRQNDQVIDG